MYLKKIDLLVWLCDKISEYNQNEKDADAGCRFGEKERWRAKKQNLENMKRLVQSGAFDAPEMEHINAYWAREGLIKHQEAEVQRLREKLYWAARIIGNVLDRGIYVAYDPWDWMQKYHQWMKNEAISGSGAREKVGTKEWRHKYFGAEWPKAEGDGNDA